MAEQINIVYPPGIGGNHLANIISLDKKYSLSVDFSVYETDGVNVHQSTQRISKKANMNLFHIGAFISTCKSIKIDSNSKNILISLPRMDQTDLAYQRLSTWAKEYRNTFVYNDHVQIYSKFLIDKLLGSSCVVINGSLIFQESLSPVLTALQQLDIQVDQLEANIYHAKWLGKIKKYVKFENSNNLVL